VAGADPAVDAPGEAGARREAGVTGPWHEYADAGLGLRFWLAVAG
jgi:hypothetical protein